MPTATIRADLLTITSLYSARPMPYGALYNEGVSAGNRRILEDMNVLVLGAGVIGAAVAHALARRDVAVTVLEMRAPGRGASWASAGLLAPYTEAHAESPLLPMGIRSLELFDEFVDVARQSSGLPLEYARTGTLEVAVTDDEVAHLAAMRTWLDRKGVPNQWFENSAPREFEPALSPRVLAGLFISQHGFVSVPGLVSALMQGALNAGAVLESSVEAVDVTQQGDQVVVEASTHRYTADHVVVATGSWSGRIRVSDVPLVPVRPVRGQLLHLRWHAAPAPLRPVWSTACYTVPWSDGTFLVGATVEEVGFDETTTASAIEQLRSAAVAVLPGATDAAMIEARAGLRPATLDGLPIIGASQAAPRVMFATGHYRNGALLAPLTASLIESAIVDGNTDAMMAWTSPNRLTQIGT